MSTIFSKIRHFTIKEFLSENSQADKATICLTGHSSEYGFRQLAISFPGGHLLLPACRTAPSAAICIYYPAITFPFRRKLFFRRPPLLPV